MKAEAPPKTSLPDVDDLRGLVGTELERWEVPGIELAAPLCPDGSEKRSGAASTM